MISTNPEPQRLFPIIDPHGRIFHPPNWCSFCRENAFIKRLYQSREDLIIAGVWGNRKYLSVDPNLLRVIWLLFGLTGTGIIAYLPAWIIIPETPSEPEPSQESSESTWEELILQRSVFRFFPHRISKNPLNLKSPTIRNWYMVEPSAEVFILKNYQ